MARTFGSKLEPVASMANQFGGSDNFDNHELIAGMKMYPYPHTWELRRFSCPIPEPHSLPVPQYSSKSIQTNNSNFQHLFLQSI